MKCLVTGGAGFIGSHLVEALIQEGHEVYIIDDLSTGSLENIPTGAIFHQKDIRDFDSIKPLFAGVEKVFHLAAFARVQPSIDNPRLSHDINTTGTQNVLLAARDNKVKRVVFASSCAIYGDQETMPLTETMEPRPISPYALQKLSGEELCGLFSKIYDLETVCLRYFNVFGPRMSSVGAYALAIGIFLTQKKQGKPLTIVPSGKQSRDFTHVYDIVKANILASRSQSVGKGEILNIGTGVEKTILGIADLIGGEKVFTEPRIEPQKFRADNSKAKELLGWEPKVKFEDGISELKEIFGVR